MGILVLALAGAAVAGLVVLRVVVDQDATKVRLTVGGVCILVLGLASWFLAFVAIGRGGLGGIFSGVAIAVGGGIFVVIGVGAFVELRRLRDNPTDALAD